MAETIRVMISEEDVDAKIAELGRQISEDYAGKQVHFKAMRKIAAEHPVEKVGEEIRQLYSWNNEEDKFINN